MVRYSAGLVRCSPGLRGFIILSSIGHSPMGHTRAAEPATQGTYWLSMVLGSSGETRHPHCGDQCRESMGLSWQERKRKWCLSPGFQCIVLVPFPFCSHKSKGSELEASKMLLEFQPWVFPVGRRLCVMKLRRAVQAPGACFCVHSISYGHGF